MQILDLPFTVGSWTRCLILPCLNSLTYEVDPIILTQDYFWQLHRKVIQELGTQLLTSDLDLNSGIDTKCEALSKSLHVCTSELPHLQSKAVGVPSPAL